VAATAGAFATSLSSMYSLGLRDSSRNTRQ